MFSVPEHIRCSTRIKSIQTRVHPLSNARKSVDSIATLFFHVDHLPPEEPVYTFKNTPYKGWRLVGMTYEGDELILKAPKEIEDEVGVPVGLTLSNVQISRLLQGSSIEEKSLLFIKENNSIILIVEEDLMLPEMQKLRRSDKGIDVQDLTEAHIGCVVDLKTSQRGDRSVLASVPYRVNGQIAGNYSVITSKEVRRWLTGSQAIELCEKEPLFDTSELSIFLARVSTGSQGVVSDELIEANSANLRESLTVSFLSKYLSVMKCFEMTFGDCVFKRANDRVFRSVITRIPHCKSKENTAESTSFHFPPAQAYSPPMVFIKAHRKDYKLIFAAGYATDTQCLELTFSSLDDLMEAFYAILDNNSFTILSRELTSGGAVPIHAPHNL